MGAFHCCPAALQQLPACSSRRASLFFNACETSPGKGEAVDPCTTAKLQCSAGHCMALWDLQAAQAAA